MNFVEIIAYGLLILFFITFNRSLFLANLGEINYSNYCCQKDGSKLRQNDFIRTLSRFIVLKACRI
jgi:hypothetical protein